MKKVLCLDVNINYVTITPRKVYDVISSYIDDISAFSIVVIVNDYDEEKLYYMKDPFAGTIFKDVTEQYRNDIIDEILL